MNNLLQVTRREVWFNPGQKSQLKKGTFDHVANLPFKLKITVESHSKALNDSFFNPGKRAEHQHSHCNVYDAQTQ